MSAPFGVHENAIDVLEKESLLEAYTDLHRLWEDIFSRLIYTRRGIPDDRVAATIHKYLEMKKDKKVYDALEKAANAMPTLLEPPKALELPESSCDSNDKSVGDAVNTAKTASILLDQVIRAIYLAFPYLLHKFDGDDDKSPLSILKAAIEKGVDSGVKQQLGLTIPIRIMSPSLLGTAAFAPTCLSSSSIDVLENVLSVTIDLGNGKKISRRFSLLQYHTLLNLHRDSDEVMAVLKAHSTPDVLLKDLEDLQNGALGLCFAVHPTVAYILQLKTIIAKCDDESRVSKAVRALRKVTGALRSRREASSAAVIGDIHCALESVTEAFDREYSAEENEEDDAEEDGEKADKTAADPDADEKAKDDKPVLPVFVQVQLLMDRAEYQVEINQHTEALKDCNTVLSLDSLCVAAYALRSRLNPPDDEEEDGEGRKKLELEVEELGSDIPNISPRRSAADKKADMLAAAASDALAAFLVGGSSDLSYASAAEEAARESCRVGARKIFEGRRREETKVSVLKDDSVDVNTVKTEVEVEKEVGVADSAPPRAWLVQSFFASYEPLRVAFGLENTPPEDDIEEEDSEGDLSTLVQSMYRDQMDAAKTIEHSQHSSSSSSSSDANGSASSGVADDIDEGTKHPNTSSGLPSPPSHLCDQNCPLDPMAYWVLRRLVGRLEATREPGPEELAVVQANDEKLKSAGYTEVLGSWVGESQRMWEDLCAEETEDNVEEDCDADVGEMKDEKDLESRKLDAEYTSVLERLDLLGAADSDKNIGYSLGLRMGGRGSLQGAQAVPVRSLSSQEAARTAAVSVAVQPVSVCEEFESEFSSLALNSDLLSHSDYTLSDPSSSSSSSTSACVGAAKENVRRPVPRSAPPCPAFTWCLNLLRMPEVAAITGVTLSPIGAVIDIEGISPPSVEEDRAMKERQKERDEKEQQETAAEKSRPSSYGRSPWFRQQEEEQDEEDDAEEDDEDEVWEDCDDDEEDEEGQEDDDNVWEDCDDEDEEECDDDDEPPRSSTVREEDEITALRNSIRSVGMGWSAEEKRVNGHASHGPAPETSSAAVDPSVKHTDNPSAPNGTDSSAASDSPIAAVPVPVPDVSHTPVVPPSSSTPVPDISSSSSAPPSSLPLDPAVSTDSAIPSDTPLTAPTPTPAAATTTSAHIAASPPLKVSRSLRARLLSVCSSIAYLSGDALGAVKCLRASVQENLTAGGVLADSDIKLGTLLVDMDQMEEADKILTKVQRENPSNAIIYLHQAELQIHRNEFQLAVSLIRKAQKSLQVKAVVLYSPSIDYRELDLSNLSHEEILQKKLRRNQLTERRRLLSKFAERQMAANVFALLGVALFRCNPSAPDIALRTLQEGIVKYPENLYLLLCTGELISQSGDAVKAIKCFKRASRLNPLHPLPYINAARTYVQLNQPTKALLHLSVAILLDESLASTRVDLSQIYLLSGKTRLALTTLQLALNMSKHVSEIRDVLTALKIAEIQTKLQEEGIYYPPAEMVCP